MGWDYVQIHQPTNKCNYTYIHSLYLVLENISTKFVSDAEFL